MDFLHSFHHTNSLTLSMAPLPIAAEGRGAANTVIPALKELLETRWTLFNT